MILRPYQQTLYDQVLAAWTAGHRNVLAMLPTGGGKTVTFAHAVHDEPGASVVLAHRQELIAQISLALAREGVVHRVIGPDSLVRLCTAGHLDELKRSYVDPSARVAIASVQSLATYKGDKSWFLQVRLWVHDEGHHVLADNLFGRAVANFPNARGLLVTATPGRTDGRGLGRHADGVADIMVRGPDAAELMRMGFLCPYKIYAPPSTFDRLSIGIGASGEFAPGQLKDATKRSSVLGDLVGHYVQHTPGKLGLSFADCIDNAHEIRERYRAADVPAEVLSGKTPDSLRASILRKFRHRDVLQIVSVALIDEGFDVPAVEVVSDGAATKSLCRFRQRFGRGWRPSAGKEFFVYNDHVGNVIEHKLPDSPKPWSLNRREKRTSSAPADAIPLTTCIKCFQPYESHLDECPHCNGKRPEPKARTSPARVDGCLHELDVNALRAAWGEVRRVDAPVQYPEALGTAARSALFNRHAERQRAQIGLREAMALHGGQYRAEGRSDAEIQRAFYLTFGLDVASAMALGAREAGELEQRIRSVL